MVDRPVGLAHPSGGGTAGMLSRSDPAKAGARAARAGIT